jgi:hypothetical protein
MGAAQVFLRPMLRCGLLLNATESRAHTIRRLEQGARPAFPPARSSGIEVAPSTFMRLRASLAIALAASAVSSLLLSQCSSRAGSNGGGGGAGDDGDSGSCNGAGCAVADASTDAWDGAVPCSAAGTCPGTLTCCGGICADVAHDPSHCGSCDLACGATQFCAGTRCGDLLLGSLCIDPSATIVLDGFADDERASGTLKDALATCSPPPSMTVVGQLDGGVLDDAGRPITGVGNAFVTAGNGFFEIGGIHYMETNGLTPVIGHDDGTTSSYTRSDGTVIVTTANSALNAGHDFFIIEMAVEPRSGTLVVSAQGMQVPGTVASAWWFRNTIVPAVTGVAAPSDAGAGDAGDGGLVQADPTTLASRWLVYEWTDTNPNLAPDPSDTFVLRGSGR